MTWRCPIGRESLIEFPAERVWRCEAGHAFDIAREGYVNLLVTHQRRQREPGDSPAMLRARRNFLDTGAYEPLREALGSFAPTAGDGRLACDAGCGEGYYTRDWPNLWGIDIAKDAVRLAARRTPAGEGTARYAVASSYDLPLADAAVDIVVSVFAPLPATEFERVVRPGGRVVTVTPGPDHLAGLAAELFETVEPHPPGGPFEREGNTTALTVVSSARVSYDLRLDRPGQVGALLAMTPWSWYVDAATRERVSGLDSLTTPIDFLVSEYALRSGDGAR